MTNRKRAFFFVPTIHRFITDFNEIVEFLVNSGVQTTVYAGTRPKGSSSWWSPDFVTDESMKCFPSKASLAELPFDMTDRSLLSFIKTIPKSYKIGKKYPQCLAVFWGVLPQLVCGLPMRFLNIRCVFLLTGMGIVFGTNTLKFRLIRTFVKIFFRYLYGGRNSRVIVHNAEDKQYLVKALGIKSDRIQVTGGCGVDPKSFPFFEELPNQKNKIILVPARLIVEKGILEAAEASNILKERGIDHEMWFTSSVVEGHPSSLTNAQVQEIEKNNSCVKFTGFHISLVPLYQACNIVCLPTRYREGLPTALIEASACGRPIVTCDNVGCREIIFHEETGLVVPPRSPVELADALARLICDDNLADTLRRNAYKQFLSKFTKQHMLDKTIEVFNDLGFVDSKAIPQPCTR